MDVLLRGRRKAMELSKTVLEIALEEAKAIREDALRLVEVAVRYVQWKEVERLELCKLWLGVENCRPRSRRSAGPASSRRGRRPSHGDDDLQPVPDGDKENRSLDNSDTKSSSDWSEAGFSPCKTSTSSQSLRDSAEDAHHGEAENGGNNGRVGTSRWPWKCEEESGSSNRNGDGCRDAPEHAETAHQYPLDQQQSWLPGSREK